MKSGLYHLPDCLFFVILSYRFFVSNLFMQTNSTPHPPPKLLDKVSDRIRVKHYSIRTETQYVQWIKRFILFHGKRHPQEMGAAEVEEFLTHLAVDGQVSASTQNQA